MYKRLTSALLHTRDDFSKVCKQLGIDAETADPKMLRTLMCDNCGFWETPSKAHLFDDGTIYCKACHTIDTLEF